MNKLIRHKVFETNSSSSHSVSVASPDQMVLDSLYPDENGVLRISGGEFGWEWREYNDALTKAQYMITYCKSSYVKEHSDEYLEILKSVLLEQTGAFELEIITPANEYYEYGYIDHQSIEDNPLDYLFDDPEQLRNFIFSKNSWLFTGNDNDSHPPNYKDVPFFEPDGNIVPVNYKYQIRFDKTDQVLLLKTNYKQEISESIRHFVANTSFNKNHDFEFDYNYKDGYNLAYGVGWLDLEKGEILYENTDKTLSIILRFYVEKI